MASKTRRFVSVWVLMGILSFCRTDGKCVDTIDICLEYDKNVCTQYKNWAKTDCPKTCGFCGPCPDGWKHYTGDQTCLLAVGLTNGNDYATWSGAGQQCQAMEGSLVIIRDEHKNYFIEDMVPKNHLVWIGVRNDGYKDTQIKYVDGTMPGSYHPFINSVTSDMRCVVLSRASRWDGYWYYKNCQVKSPYVCQKRATPDIS